MKTYAAFLVSAATHRVHGADLPDVLPDIAGLIELAYPTWCIDSNENRLTDIETCADGTPNGKWNPIYLTKQHSGADPKLGGYPTPIDVQYAFEYASPYLGQPCAGSPHHCPEDFDGSLDNCKTCPKMVTDNDHGPYGPGHVPPHIALAAVTKAYNEKSAGDVTSWFDYDQNACRILPAKLLKIIRIYYPRNSDGKVHYPPPYSVSGGAYPLEFANFAGESCEKAAAKHPHAGSLQCIEQHSSVDVVPDTLEVGYGSPHYCSKESAAAGVASDYCPYITFGPNRGKYRHPHLAYSAVETYLANKIMPNLCSTTWDDSDYPPEVDNTQAFPEMTPVDASAKFFDDAQPTIFQGLWIWPGPEGTKKKAVVGEFATQLVVVKGYKSEGVNGDSANDMMARDGFVLSGGSLTRKTMLQSVLVGISTVMIALCIKI